MNAARWWIVSATLGLVMLPVGTSEAGMTLRWEFDFTDPVVAGGAPPSEIDITLFDLSSSTTRRLDFGTIE